MFSTALIYKSPAFRLHRRKFPNHRVPNSPETKRRIAETTRAYWRMSAEERQDYRETKALYKARWLIECFKPKDHQLVFDETVPHDDTRKPTRLLIAVPEDAKPQDMLCAIMRHPDAPLVMRLDAAKHAAVFMHPRKSTLMKVILDASSTR